MKYVDCYTNKALRNLIINLRFDVNILSDLTNTSVLMIKEFMRGGMQLPYHVFERFKNRIIDYLCEQ